MYHSNKPVYRDGYFFAVSVTDYGFCYHPQPQSVGSPSCQHGSANKKKWMDCGRAEKELAETELAESKVAEGEWSGD